MGKFFRNLFDDPLSLVIGLLGAVVLGPVFVKLAAMFSVTISTAFGVMMGMALQIIGHGFDWHALLMGLSIMAFFVNIGDLFVNGIGKFLTTPFGELPTFLTNFLINSGMIGYFILVTLLTISVTGTYKQLYEDMTYAEGVGDSASDLVDDVVDVIIPTINSLVMPVIVGVGLLIGSTLLINKFGK